MIVADEGNEGGAVLSVKGSSEPLGATSEKGHEAKAHAATGQDHWSSQTSAAPVDASEAVNTASLVLGRVKLKSSTRAWLVVTSQGILDSLARHQKATTEDGYVIEVDRVGLSAPENNSSLTENSTNRYPIIMIPGITQDSGSWFVNFPSESPGFLLAQRGYDVWAMNTREIADRSRHETLSKTDDRFNEIGRYDIAAVIDLVLNVTGASRVNMLAFFQGTTGSLVLLSTKAGVQRQG
ncbi:hypothetical protein MRX96_002373 [Rhipicephalus microplus]